MGSLASTVYLVDDDQSIRKSLTRLLLSAGHHVRSHTSAEEFLSHHDPNAHGCAIMDLSLPGMDGLDAQQLLLARRVDLPIIFISGWGDVPTSVRAMKAGAVDFLTKPVDASALLAAVDHALVRDLRQKRGMEQKRSVNDRLATLTPRERQVLMHVTAGRLNKQIAADLGTVEKTIKVHRARMMKKMGVRTVADLVRIVTSVDFPEPSQAPRLGLPAMPPIPGTKGPADVVDEGGLFGH